MKTNLLLFIIIILFILITPSYGKTLNATIQVIPRTTSIIITQSSDSGTSGTGIISTEPLSNIEVADRYESSLKSGNSVPYKFKGNDIIYEIDVTGTTNEDWVMIRVEILKGHSASINIDPFGKVYKYTNIIAGTHRITESIVKFKVPNTWLSENNIESLELYKWDGAWKSLPTTIIGKDGFYNYYEAKNQGFSSFAIVAQEATNIEASVNLSNETEIIIEPESTTTTAQQTSDGFTPNIYIIAVTICLIIIILLLIYIRNK